MSDDEKISTVRVNVILPTPMKDELEILALQRGVTLPDVVRSAIGHELLADEIVKQGGAVIAELPDKRQMIIANQYGTFEAYLTGKILPERQKP